MSFGKDNFIGLRFFDAIRIEAKIDSEEMTGDLGLYTHLPVSEVLIIRSALFTKHSNIPNYPDLPY